MTVYRQSIWNEPALSISGAGVMARIKQDTGFDVENISAEEEAQLFFKAAICDFSTGQRYAFVDMAGGSAQVLLAVKTD